VNGPFQAQFRLQCLGSDRPERAGRGDVTKHFSSKRRRSWRNIQVSSWPKDKPMIAHSVRRRLATWGVLIEPYPSASVVPIDPIAYFSGCALGSASSCEAWRPSGQRAGRCLFQPTTQHRAPRRATTAGDRGLGSGFLAICVDRSEGNRAKRSTMAQ
jgi:hypothetical protein